MTVPISDGDTSTAAESALIAFSAADTASGTDSNALTPQDRDFAVAVDTEVRSAVTDTLAIWLPSVNAPAASDYFSWGSVAAGSSGDKQFRVKNISSSSKANDVTVTLNGSGSGAANPANLHLLSADERRFTDSVELGALIPGAISGVVTLRRVIPYSASLGAAAFDLVLSAASWGVDFYPSSSLSLEVSSSDTASGVDTESVVP